MERRSLLHIKRKCITNMVYEYGLYGFPSNLLNSSVKTICITLNLMHQITFLNKTKENAGNYDLRMIFFRILHYLINGNYTEDPKLVIAASARKYRNACRSEYLKKS